MYEITQFYTMPIEKLVLALEKAVHYLGSHHSKNYRWDMIVVAIDN